MAGTIVSLHGRQWSAASWLFDWVLRTVADQMLDVELAGELRGIVDENLGWLSLDDLPARQRTDILKIICDSLLPIAEREMPTELPNRQHVIQRIRDLVTTSCKGR